MKTHILLAAVLSVLACQQNDAPMESAPPPPSVQRTKIVVIAGRVTDTAERPMADIPVVATMFEASNASGQCAGAILSGAPQIQSDTEGRFRIELLAPPFAGDVCVRVAAPHGQEERIVSLGRSFHEVIEVEITTTH